MTEGFNGFNVAWVNGRGFGEAVEAIHHGLIEAGHDSVVTRGWSGLRDHPDRRRIVFGALLGRLMRERFPDTDWRQLIRDDDIVYNAEQLRDHLVDEKYEIGEIIREREVWDYSAKNVDYLRARGCPKPVLVPLGSVSALRRIPRHDYDADVMFYGLINPRRQPVLDALQSAGLRCRFFGKENSIWGAERDDLIGRTKIVLNVHFYDYKIFEVFRTFYPMLNGRCVVSEEGIDANERLYDGAAVFAEYGGLVGACLRYANDDRLLHEQEERAEATMCLFRQADILERALAES